ncbi:hypothetical protein FRX31_019274, partial [Thalictrum thalictroides]
VTQPASVPEDGSPVAPAPSDDCFNSLLNMSDCLTFVEAESNLTTPDKLKLLPYLLVFQPQVKGPSSMAGLSPAGGMAPDMSMTPKNGAPSSRGFTMVIFVGLSSAAVAMLF